MGEGPPKSDEGTLRGKGLEQLENARKRDAAEERDIPNLRGKWLKSQQEERVETATAPMYVMRVRGEEISLSIGSVFVQRDGGERWKIVSFTTRPDGVEMVKLQNEAGVTLAKAVNGLETSLNENGGAWQLPSAE